MTRMRHHRYRDRAVDGNQDGPVPCHERHLGLSVSSLRKADQPPPMACSRSYHQRELKAATHTRTNIYTSSYTPDKAVGY